MILNYFNRRPKEKTVIEKVHSKSSNKFDINSCVIEERTNPGSSTASNLGAGSIPSNESSQRPVSRFKMNRTSWKNAIGVIIWPRF